MADSRPFLIIGQGISGSLVAWFLLKAGAKVLVVDPCEELTASRIAAGLIHPVTGRRLVKSWMADILIPFARKTYVEMENRIAAQFFEDYPVFERFHSAGHRNDWAGKSTEPGMEPYIGEECSPEAVPQGIVAPHGGRWMLGGGWLDTVRFLDAMRTYLERMNSFQCEHLDYASLEYGSSGVQWNGLTFQKVIDCSGARAFHEPLFAGIGLNPCAGELIQITSHSLPRDIVIHGRMKVIPLGGYSYLAGATYYPGKTAIPLESEGLQEICSALTEMLKDEFQVDKQVSGIRPSSIDRRPLIGPHRTIPQLYVFNGLGSKGVMLGPWMAERLAEHLLFSSDLRSDCLPYRSSAPD
jgi:glycine/D-amino acid oxidase-like deaminating enzyme